MQTKATVFDMLESLSLPDTTPYFYFLCQLSNMPDMTRLQEALEHILQSIPEIGCRYDIQQQAWLPLSHIHAPQLLFHVDTIDFSTWNLLEEPQLQIQYQENTHGIVFAIAFSHLLCDGQGALQFLYLFANCYRDPSYQIPQNKRQLSYTKKQTSYSYKKRKTPAFLSFDHKSNGMCEAVIKRYLPLTRLSNIAQIEQVSINDILLCLYVQALQDLYDLDKITLPCPVNMRNALKQPPSLSITNFTGEYQVTLHHVKDMDARFLLHQIHEAMTLEKKRCHDLHLTPWLSLLYRCLPLSASKKLARRQYHVPAISFTNLGKADPALLTFADFTILHMEVVTMPRRFPSFQLSAFTYQDICTITCHSIGTTLELAKIEQLFALFMRKLEAYEQLLQEENAA